MLLLFLQLLSGAVSFPIIPGKIERTLFKAEGPYASAFDRTTRKKGLAHHASEGEKEGKGRQDVDSCRGIRL